jgi:hypothetical protein
MIVPPHTSKHPNQFDFIEVKKKFTENEDRNFLNRQSINSSHNFTHLAKSNLENSHLNSRPSSKTEHEIIIPTKPLSKLTPINNIKSSCTTIEPLPSISQFKDSAYNTTSSNEDPDLEKETKIRSAFSAANSRKTANTDHYQSEFVEHTNESVVNRVKMQHEEFAVQKKNKVITSDFNHKIVGGVKVFPSLPHPSRQAAIEARKQRLNAIEASLAELENRSKCQDEIKTSTKIRESEFDSSTKYQTQNEYNLSLSNFDDGSETEHEIIDLTRRRETLESKKFYSEKSATRENSSHNVIRDIPIEFLNTNALKENNSYQHSSKTTTSNEKNIDFFTTDTKKELNDTSSLDQKVNYIYYYDNEQFGGY